MKNTQRPIKFRAWNKLNSNPKERMIYPAILDSDGEVIMPDGDSWDIPVMQYTGLRDSNGKEIYEGDIVKWIADDGTEEYPHEREIIEEVKFECGAYQVLSSLPGIKFEIIGNIYEKQNKT